MFIHECECTSDKPYTCTCLMDHLKNLRANSFWHPIVWEYIHFVYKDYHGPNLHHKALYTHNGEKYKEAENAQYGNCASI